MPLFEIRAHLLLSILVGAAAAWLSVQHVLPPLFHGVANHFSQARLNLPFIDLDHLAKLRFFLACFLLPGGLDRHSPRTFCFADPIRFTGPKK
jgi:hypothetical protein